MLFMKYGNCKYFFPVCDLLSYYFNTVFMRAMQIKTTMRYHFTPVRMVIIKRSTNNKYWTGCGEKGLFLPLWKTVWRFLKKLGIKPPYDPAIPLLGIYPEETKIEKDTCIP